MKKIIPGNHLIFLIVIFAMLLPCGCGKEKNPSNNDGIGDITHLDIRGNCLNQPGSPRPAHGYMVLEVQGNDLQIQHFDAFYNCCIEYAVDYQIDNYSITANETDVANSPCFCDCYFNLKSTVFDLPDGFYTVTLIGIEGDTVGTDTVTVGDNTVNYSNFSIL